MKTLLVLSAALALFAAVSGANDSPSPIADWFDCTNKPANNAHPIDCTRFLMCSNGIAYEMDCAICDYHPVRCPQGRLVFDHEHNMCLYADQAKCISLCDRDRPGEGDSSSSEEVKSFKARKPL